MNNIDNLSSVNVNNNVNTTIDNSWSFEQKVLGLLGAICEGIEIPGGTPEEEEAYRRWYAREGC